MEKFNEHKLSLNSSKVSEFQRIYDKLEKQQIFSQGEIELEKLR